VDRAALGLFADHVAPQLRAFAGTFRDHFPNEAEAHREAVVEIAVAEEQEEEEEEEEEEASL